MMREETLIRKAIERQLGDAQDNAYRARAAFKHMTPDDMAQQHGHSGRTRADILREYVEWEYDCKSALAYFNDLVKAHT